MDSKEIWNLVSGEVILGLEDGHGLLRNCETADKDLVQPIHQKFRSPC